MYMYGDLFFLSLMGQQVCSNKNVTFDSECHMDREHCLCRKKLPECRHPRHGKIQLDYYGQCRRESGVISSSLSLDFPLRFWWKILSKYLSCQKLDLLCDKITV